MLLRDFIYLDWESRYYVIHAGDHIRLRRVLEEEYKHESNHRFEWMRKGKPKTVEWITLNELKEQRNDELTEDDFKGPRIVIL